MRPRTHDPAPAERAPAPAAPAPELPLTSAGQVLALQRSAGNAAVTRVLARDDKPFQLTPPTLFGGRPKHEGVLGDYHLHLDNEVQLKILEAQLAPDNVRQLFTQIPLPDLPAPAPPDPKPAQPKPGPGDRPPGPFDVDPTQPGQIGDIVTALGTIPELDRLAQNARERLWTQLPTGDKWILGVSGVSLALAGLGGALATPSGRELLGKLSGRPLTIPGVPWFQPEFNVQGPNLIIGLHVDIGAFLGGTGGFGAAPRGPVPFTPQGP